MFNFALNKVKFETIGTMIGGQGSTWEPLSTSVLDALIDELIANPLSIEGNDVPPSKRRKLSEPELMGGKDEELNHESIDSFGSHEMLQVKDEDDILHCDRYCFPFSSSIHQSLEASSQYPQNSILETESSSTERKSNCFNQLPALHPIDAMFSEMTKCADFSRQLPSHDEHLIISPDLIFEQEPSSSKARSPENECHWNGSCLNCSTCGLNTTSVPENQQITCVHCGDAVSVQKQHIHPCVIRGIVPIFCMECKISQESSFEPLEYKLNTLPSTSDINEAPSDCSDSIPKRRGRKAKCDKCSLVFKSVRSKQEHMVTRHQDELSCHICSAVLRSEENLRRHMLCHSANAPHTCTRCSASFNHRRSLRVHLRKCGVDDSLLSKDCDSPSDRNESAKQFSCAFCPKRFSVRPSVSRHIRIVHEGQRPHTCTYCGKTFTSKYNMQVHSMKNHSEMK